MKAIAFTLAITFYFITTDSVLAQKKPKQENSPSKSEMEDLMKEAQKEI